MIAVSPQSHTDWYMHYATASSDIEIIFVQPAEYEKSQTQPFPSRNNDLFIIESVNFPIVTPPQTGRKIPTRNDDCSQCLRTQNILERLRESLRPP